jgi:hypothetical protein
VFSLALFVVVTLTHLQEELAYIRTMYAGKEAEAVSLQQCRETVLAVTKRLTAARTPEAKRIPRERVRSSFHSVFILFLFGLRYGSNPHYITGYTANGNGCDCVAQVEKEMDHLQQMAQKSIRLQREVHKLQRERDEARAALAAATEQQEQLTTAFNGALLFLLLGIFVAEVLLSFSGGK